ncbi:MAG TPA: PDZ domain-containing protein [Rhodanobacteraceae bacterium]
MLKWIILLAALVFSTLASAADAPLLLLRHPSMNQTSIAFEYGGELWTVPRTGGQAHVLASGMDLMAMPIYSPNGQWIAFTGTFDHNTDVYVVPATGGQPRRLTWHPGPDIAVGWTRDGKAILFRSHRHSFADPDQLYTVPLAGGFPHELPLPAAESGSYSPDGTHLAYVPDFQWEPFWKGYKGGQHTQVWLARLSDSSVVRIPDMNANENNPMWVGGNVYFLSDRDGPITLYDYNVKAAKVSQVIDNTGFDITAASAGPGGIVYSQFGQIHIYDFATGKTHVVPITVDGDLPQRRPRYENVAKQLTHAGISPTGVRALFDAHGDILTVPVKDGSPINLTDSPGAMDRNPAWSPNGKSIAYFSDAAGEYDLYIRAQNGTGSARRIALGQNDAFYYDITWSPDSQKIAFYDQKLNLWLVNLTQADPKPIKVKTGYFMQRTVHDVAWSPDSRWLTFTQVQPNYLRAVEIYSLATGKIHQITDGMSDCLSPVFDADGKYLYFISSTDTALTSGWLSMSSLQHPVTYSVYALPLTATQASPLAPKTGDDHGVNGKASSTHKGGKAAPHVAIDFAHIQARAVALPIKAADYAGIYAGKSGVLYLLKAPVIYGSAGPMSVLRFDIKSKKTETVTRDVSYFALSANGEKMLYRQGSHWFIADAKPHNKPKALDTGDLRVRVVPNQSWTQMYHDAWRIERAFFYSPIFDGLNIAAAEKEFAHYLPGLASRQGLSFLFREMMSYMSVGHMFITGGYVPKMDEVKVGLLGANYALKHGHYRITRIFNAGAWNPHLYAPLAQPGLKVKVGNYVLAVNGRSIDGKQSIYRAFVDLAGKTVTLTVGPNPSMQGAHQITVKTITSERRLRHVAWMVHNMQVVNRLSHGQLAYIYLPDTAMGGFTNFNRYYFAQVDKHGAIIDERFNHGGYISDYIIDHLMRKPMSFGVTRWGQKKTAVAPPMQIYGPKVMLINQFAGSGGDALPWYFKMAKVGTLVGERTWGGLVGIGGYPTLMDGGSITAPRYGVEGLNGTFPVENHGIAPDVTVWQNPELVRQGHDPQLEAAVKIAMQQLKANPPKTYQRPAWRNYHPKLPPLPTTGDH